MSTEFVFKELESLDELLSSYTCILEMYPSLSKTDYREMILEMMPNNYSQLAVYKNSKMVAVCGIWINTKLWCGKYMELDNVIVQPDYRSAGIGKLVTGYLNKKAKEIGCKLMALDAYTDNKRAHKFYMNDGYDITGFHFTKKL